MITKLLQLYEEMDRVVQDSIRVGVTPELVERSKNIRKRVEELRKKEPNGVTECAQIIEVSRRIQHKIQERINELR